MSKIEYQLDDSQKKWSLRSPEWHTDIVSNKCEMKKWHTHTVTSIDCNLNVEICRILSIVNCSNFIWVIYSNGFESHKSHVCQNHMWKCVRAWFSCCSLFSVEFGNFVRRAMQPKLTTLPSQSWFIYDYI